MEKSERPFEEKTNDELLGALNKSREDITMVETLLKKRALSKFASSQHLFQQTLTDEDVEINSKEGKIIVRIAMSKWGVNDEDRFKNLMRGIKAVPGIVIERKLYNFLDFSKGYLEVTMLSETEEDPNLSAGVSAIQDDAKEKIKKLRRPSKK